MVRQKTTQQCKFTDWCISSLKADPKHERRIVQTRHIMSSQQHKENIVLHMATKIQSIVNVHRVG